MNVLLPHHEQAEEIVQNRALLSPRSWPFLNTRESILLPEQQVLLEWAGVDDHYAVLDASCQNSALLSYFLQRYQIRACGINHNFENVRQAGKELGIKAEVLCASSLDVPFRSASFDRIFISEVLKNQADTYSFLQELHRALKPGGQLVMSVPSMPILTKLGLRIPGSRQDPFLDCPWMVMDQLHQFGFIDITMRTTWGFFSVIKAGKADEDASIITSLL